MQISSQESKSTSQTAFRIVTSSALFDGHDAAINIVRRLLQKQGCHVIHLGHNHSVANIVQAAIQEDAHAICISSYQGGHVEFFKYIIDSLKDNYNEKHEIETIISRLKTYIWFANELAQIKNFDYGTKSTNTKI